MKVPFELIVRESIGFFVSQIPILGSAYQIYDGAKRTQEIREIANRLEKQESSPYTAQDLGYLGSTKRTFHKFSGTEIGGIYRSTNLLLDPITHCAPYNDFYYKIYIEPNSGPILWGDGSFGMSLCMSNPESGQPLSEFIILLSNGENAVFGILGRRHNIVAETDIPRSDIYEFTMGSRKGILSCSVNKMRIFSGKSIIYYPFEFGFYMDKGSSISYSASIVM